jgi:hypothetical protein
VTQSNGILEVKFDNFDPAPKFDELENDINRLKFQTGTNQLDIKKLTESVIYYSNYSKSLSTKG